MRRTQREARRAGGGIEVGYLPLGGSAIRHTRARRLKSSTNHATARLAQNFAPAVAGAQNIPAEEVAEVRGSAPGGAATRPAGRSVRAVIFDTG